MGFNNVPLEGVKGRLIYELAEIEFCSDVQNIVSVITFDETTLFERQDYLFQIEYNELSYRMIDLHKKCNLKPFKISINVKIIIHEMFGKRFCFITDNVKEILTTDRIFVEKSLDLIPCTNKKFISSIINYQNRKIYMPDFERITKELDKLPGLRQLVHH